MVVATRVDTYWIKKKDKENSYGQMDGNMKVRGKLESNMAREDITRCNKKLGKESGLKEKEFDGLVTLNNIFKFREKHRIS